MLISACNRRDVFAVLTRCFRNFRCAARRIETFPIKETSWNEMC
ncbi:MAG: hypothetical protein ACTS6G_01100 [Candidatus Hodgkinia cicadicola]